MYQFHGAERLYDSFKDTLRIRMLFLITDRRHTGKEDSYPRILYREEMCPPMLEEIKHVTSNNWIWQQDGAKADMALASVAWPRENTPDLITASQ